MRDFEWTDREGVLQHLDSPALIEAEVEAISREIDDALAAMPGADLTRKAELRVVVRNHLNRLQQLNTDGEGWNAFAYERTRDAAITLAAQIEQLHIEIGPMEAVYALHVENEEAIRDEQNLSHLMAERRTNAQQLAMYFSTIEPKPPAEASRGEVREWLNRDPAFYRPRTDEGGWFEWKDNEGRIHRLVSPLQIEKEVVLGVHELKKRLPHLQEGTSHFEMIRAIEDANTISERLAVLQADLDRFTREAERREDEEWEQLQRDWRAGREKQ